MPEALYKMEIRDKIIFVSFRHGLVGTSKLLMEAIDREIELNKGKIRDDLWDFRGCWASAELKHDSMQKIVEHIEERNRFRWPSHTALLVDQDANYGLARMFQTIAEFMAYDVGVFRDEKEAKDWLASKRNSTNKESGS